MRSISALIEVITLADALAIDTSKLAHARISYEGKTVGMAYPNTDRDGVLLDYTVEAYPADYPAGQLNWDNLALAKMYVAAKMLNRWELVSELHPSNSKESVMNYSKGDKVVITNKHLSTFGKVGTVQSAYLKAGDYLVTVPGSFDSILTEDDFEQAQQ